MTTENHTPKQLMRDRWMAQSRAEAEQRRLAREQWLSSPLDISEDAAREMTGRLKAQLESLFTEVHAVEQLVLEVHNQRAWLALGCSSWQQYVNKELALSRSRSYKLLGQGRLGNYLRQAADTALSSLDRWPPEPPDQRPS